jgi:hypothetical protein
MWTSVSPYFEGRQRYNQAMDAVERLRKNVDTLIVIPNDRLLSAVDTALPVQAWREHWSPSYVNCQPSYLWFCSVTHSRDPDFRVCQST